MLRKTLIIISTITLTAITILWLTGIRLHKMASNSSMFPTLQQGDFFLVKLNPDISKLQRGDIVLLHNHTDFIGLPILTKRIIGLPNETIRISNDSVFVDERYLSESYAFFEISNNAYSRVEKVMIPCRYYFVAGDNRDMSVDSRDSRFGIINGKNIIGKIIWIF